MKRRQRSRLTAAAAATLAAACLASHAGAMVLQPRGAVGAASASPASRGVFPVSLGTAASTARGRSRDPSWGSWLWPALGAVGCASLVVLGVAGWRLSTNGTASLKEDPGGMETAGSAREVGECLIGAPPNLATDDSGHGGQVGSAKPETPIGDDDEESGTGRVDLERFLELLAKRLVQRIGPKVTKANNVKMVMQKAVGGLARKASVFLQDEMCCVMARLLKEAEAEEIMLLFNPSESIGANLPPASILIAGLFSPIVLSVSLVVHLSQVLLVLVPVAAMCAWAVVTDHDSLGSCAVPTIWLWVHVQGGIALVLLVAHLATSALIWKGKVSIQQKAFTLSDRFKHALSDGELNMEELRELFIIIAILLEHSLVVEDSLRRSLWRKVIGVCTLLQIFATIWAFVLVLGWTFVPGMVAFSASTSSVANGEYCGAWATVFCARLGCVLSLFFLFFNLAAVGQFVSDQLVLSEAYSAAVVRRAQAFDESMLGVPVVQTLVRAFLLRGTADTMSAQLAVKNDSQQALERKRDQLASDIEALKKRVSHHKAQAQALMDVAGYGSQAAEDMVQPSSPMEACMAGDLASLEGALPDAAAVMEKAKELEQTTKQELERMYESIREAVNHIGSSDTVKNAISQAQQATQAGIVAASAVASDGVAYAQRTSVQDALAQAQQATQAGLEAATVAASDGVDFVQRARTASGDSSGVLAEASNRVQGLVSGATAAVQGAQPAQASQGAQGFVSGAAAAFEGAQGAANSAQGAVKGAQSTQPEQKSDSAVRRKKGKNR